MLVATRRRSIAILLAAMGFLWAILAEPLNESLHIWEGRDPRIALALFFGIPYLLGALLLRSRLAVLRMSVGVVAAYVFVGSLPAGGAFVYMAPSGLLLVTAFALCVHELAYPQAPRPPSSRSACL